MAQFERPGSISGPGPVGRAVRFLIGMGCLSFLSVLFMEGNALVGTDFPMHPGWWAGMLIGLWVLPGVINIGYRLSLGRWPQVAVLTVIIAFVILNLLQAQRMWSPLLGMTVLVWLIYEYAHLGISFILAGIVGTPG